MSTVALATVVTFTSSEQAGSSEVAALPRVPGANAAAPTVGIDETPQSSPSPTTEQPTSEASPSPSPEPTSSSRSSDRETSQPEKSKPRKPSPSPSPSPTHEGGLGGLLGDLLGG
jgi:hypothetical protein